MCSMVEGASPALCRPQRRRRPSVTRYLRFAGEVKSDHSVLQCKEANG